MEKGVARVEPAKCWQKKISVQPELLPNCREKPTNRRHSVTPNKSIHLHPKRHECDQIDESKHAEKPAARPKISRRSHASAPQPSSKGRSEAAMPRDEFVSGLGDSSETRNVIVAPPQPFPRGSISQRPIHGFGGKEGFAIRLDKCNRSLKLFDWNFREPRRSLLIGGIIHFTGGDFAPTFDPPLAKMTLTVPNHERLWRPVRNAEVRFVSH